MKKNNQGNQTVKKTKKRNRKTEAKVKDESVINDSDGLGEMRDSILEMETELAAMDNDIANAEALEDPEMREIAVSGMRELKRMTTDMIDSTHELMDLLHEGDKFIEELERLAGGDERTSESEMLDEDD